MPRFLAVLAVILLISMEKDLFGQSGIGFGPYGGSIFSNPIGGRGVRRYSPPGGATLPNSLNYFRADTGVLDPYNMFVSPSRNLSANLNRMSRQQDVNYATTERQIKELSQIRSSNAAPTGTGAGYMNYSHYYPSGGTRR